MARQIVDISTDHGKIISSWVSQSIIDSLNDNVPSSSRQWIYENYQGTPPGYTENVIIETKVSDAITYEAVGNLITLSYEYYNGTRGTSTIITFWTNSQHSSAFDTNTIYSGELQGYRISFAFIIDDDTHKGWTIVGRSSIAFDIIYSNIYAYGGTENMYNAIKGAIVPDFQWSSVPAISGKNGILSLPTLVDTDGNPISGQSASVFSSLPEGSNVRALINGAL